MLIFFGIRSPFIGSALLKENVSCNYCNVENNLRISVFGSYFHVFWIPIMSFGRTIEVTCLHCKKTYNEKEIPNNLKPTVDAILRAKTMKSPKWHSLGCFAVLTLVALTLTLAFFAFVGNLFRTSHYEKEVDTTKTETIEIYKDEEKVYREKVKAFPEWKKDLREIMFSSLTEPSIVKDPVSYNLKSCLEPKLPFIEEYSLSYITHFNNDKILLLIEAGDYNDYTVNQKNEFYKELDFCVKNVLKGESYKTYVGVYKSTKLLMQKTPNQIIKDSISLESNLLKEFFD